MLSIQLKGLDEAGDGIVMVNTSANRGAIALVRNSTGGIDTFHFTNQTWENIKGLSMRNGKVGENLYDETENGRDIVGFDNFYSYKVGDWWTATAFQPIMEDNFVLPDTDQIGQSVQSTFNESSMNVILARNPRFGAQETQQMCSVDYSGMTDIVMKDWVITGFSSALLAAAGAACATLLAF